MKTSYVCYIAARNGLSASPCGDVAWFSHMMYGLLLIVDIEGTVAEIFDDNRLLTSTAEDAQRCQGMNLTGMLPPEACR